MRGWTVLHRPDERVVAAAGRPARLALVAGAPGSAHRPLDADDALLHPPVSMDPTWARKEAHEAVLLAAYLAHRDDAPDFWDVPRVVIVEYLSAGLPGSPTGSSSAGVGARGGRRDAPPAGPRPGAAVLYDDGRTSRHEEGRFRSADLALLFGIEPTSVRAAARTARQRLAAEREGRR